MIIWKSVLRWTLRSNLLVCCDKAQQLDLLHYILDMLLQGEGEVYTLLPGYVSRPNPSPFKRQRTEPPAPEGGFVKPVGSLSQRLSSGHSGSRSVSVTPDRFQSRVSFQFLSLLSFQPLILASAGSVFGF